MWRDPIVAELHLNREAYAVRFNHDIKAICRAAREQQKKADTRLFHCRHDRSGVRKADSNLKPPQNSHHGVHGEHGGRGDRDPAARRTWPPRHKGHRGFRIWRQRDPEARPPSELASVEPCLETTFGRPPPRVWDAEEVTR